MRSIDPSNYRRASGRGKKRGREEKKGGEKLGNLRVFESSESRRRARNVYVHEKSSIAMATRNVTKDIGETKAVTVLWIGRAKTILEVERENNATWDPGGTSP